ncbi:MAG: NYN domain-containing protein [Candidatus Krumholzibacteria bacterium]|nr:NYN domain-containing protein [Candidatus Krumholzibacteria bacterium]MCK5619301.1 NYN domain-containing protein [Candidatus Krumholzibacteria bacterium]
MQKIIVDGYNVIHADERLKRLVRQDLLEARRKLVERLARYLERKNLQTTVVFDGRGGLTDVDVEIPGKLQVLFSASGQTADDLIIEILETSSNAREYIVATSDMADIGRTARAMGAQVVESRAFLARIDQKKRQIEENAPDEIVEDVDYWLERFRGSDDLNHEGGK